MAIVRRDLLGLLSREPFQPFCINLANGDRHVVFDPLTASLLRGRVFIASPDGEWAILPFDQIASIESLFVEPPSHD